MLQSRMAAIKAGRYNRLYLEQYQNYGKTWEENLAGTKVINSMEPENFQQVASLSFQDYGKLAMRNKALSPFLGNGIFSQDGASWKHSRDLIKPLFTRAELSDIDSFEVHVNRFLNLIPRDGSTVDLHPLLLKLFLDSSTQFIFGESVNSLIDTPFDAQEFLDAFSQALQGAGRRAQAGKLRFVFLFDNKKWKSSCDKVHAFVDRHVARALAETKPTDDPETESPSSPRYILINEIAKQIRDPIDLRFQVINVFFPARDSTGIALSNAFFNLARNPGVWTELREQALALGDQPLTFELLKSLTFFKYVLFESLRLQGPSGRVARTAIQDTILPRGGGPDGTAPIFVQKGTIVALNTYAPNHWKDTWGEDVEEFRPKRWIGSKHTWDWTPFFGGPRICPAQQQVLTQAVYLLVRMVTAFEKIENRDPSVAYVELTKMLTESRNGAKVALHPPG
ncbi:MAG: hypothetical protein ALECFALPRED_006997 [Alectoria fallacina]|uniref:Cytochrome P450 n=1 Tax=Alectoria fallacina TaxID=1903189 RepID=A0A8H3G6R9_9LECA|nr:MAG: hypothetical protein ALECFALPRED_006997 [Alectoria fallacina]